MKNETSLGTLPLFSAIIFAWRPQFFKRSLAALRNQTYKNLEIIIVDNTPAQDNLAIGAEITKMVDEYASQDSRIRVLRIPRKQYSLQEALKNYDDCCHEALKQIRGEYFIVQNDDDYMAPDYVEKLIKLFQENPKCISATGLTIAVDDAGNPTDTETDHLYNHRPRHMPGHVMAWDGARGGFMFSAPGLTVFAFKKDAFMKLGGHPESSDLGYLFCIIAFGDTGFDPTAKFFWLRHPDQFNKQLSSAGWVRSHGLRRFIKESKVEQRWKEAFGNAAAKDVMKKINSITYEYPARWFAINLYKGRLKSCFNLAAPVWDSLLFWRTLPGALWSYNPIVWNRRKILIGSFYALKLNWAVKGIKACFPSTFEKSEFLKKLGRKVG